MWVLLAATSMAADTLPVERVRFYETGVAWFERSGTVRTSTDLRLPRSHLDDALKSLVVLGGGAEVQSVTFPAAVSDRAARTLAGLPAETPASYGEGLQALVGGPVAVRTRRGPRHQGTLLSVDAVPQVGGTEGPRALDVPAWALGLLTPEGALLRILTPDVAEVRSLAPDQQWRLEQAGRSFAASRSNKPHGLRVDLTRGGSLAVGYLAEAPVWRTNYRIVADAEGGARLQAWALIHNDTDEDWSNVTVEVANGQPRSFLYPMAAPRYLRRPLETPTTPMSTVPQLAALTPDSLWDEEEAIGVGGLSMSASGYGSGGGTFGAKSGGGIGSAPADLRRAEPVDTPTQFVVRVADPVDLPAHHSALVPLGMDALTTERAVALTPDSQHPRTAVWMANTTGRTLPDGVVTVLAGGGFSGETVLARTKPDERQMLLVGEELDVDVDRSRSESPARPTTVRWNIDDMRWSVTEARDQRTTLAIRNRSGRPRALWSAFRIGPASAVEGDVRTEVDPQRGWTWVVSEAPPGPSTATVVVAATHTQTLGADAISGARYRDWADRELADPAELRRAAGLSDRLAELRGTDEDLASRTRRLTETRERLRRDLEAAKGGATRQLTRRLTSLEADIQRFGERRASLEAEQEDVLTELHALLDGLTT
ncbi:MAG: hypothetical protein AAF602_18120 [Myxococcota bacterium]